MITLHKMTWEEFSKHNSAAIDHLGDPRRVIPETYYFIGSDGCWYSVDKGAVGWNIYDEGWHYITTEEKLSTIRKYY